MNKNTVHKIRPQMFKECNANSVETAFREYYAALGISFKSMDELTDGLLISQFLQKVDAFPLTKQSLIQDAKSIYGASISNLKTVVNSIVIFQKETLRNQNYSLTYDYFEIYNTNEGEQYKKANIIQCLLIQALRVAIEGSNSEFFIRKVMSLSDKSQKIFINLIKDFIKSIPTTPNATPESTPAATPKLLKIDSQHGSPKRSSEDIKILQLQIHRLLTQNQILLQNQQYFEQQISQLKDQNSKLTCIIDELQNRIDLMNRQRDREQSQIVQTINTQLSQINQESQQLIFEHAKQRQQLKRIYQQKLEQFRQKIIAKQNSEIQLKNQIQQLALKFQQTSNLIIQKDRERAQLLQFKKRHLSSNNTLQEENNRLLRELQKQKMKNQELQLIISLRDYDVEQKEEKIKMCTVEHLMFEDKHTQALQCHKFSVELKRSQQEIIILKKTIKEKERQIEGLKKQQSKIKGLEGDKKRLMNTLKEYEQYRGQQNQILMGCIYQMKLNNINRVEGIRNKKQIREITESQNNRKQLKTRK